MEISSSSLNNVASRHNYDPSYGPLIGKAMAALIDHLNEDVSPEQILFLRQEFVVYPDASLGAPEDGHYYAQVQTPGYKISLQYKGVTYVVHTDMECDRAIVAAQ